MHLYSNHLQRLLKFGNKARLHLYILDYHLCIWRNRSHRHTYHNPISNHVYYHNNKPSFLQNQHKSCAYSSRGNCGHDGENANWEWCKQKEGACAKLVSTSKCRSGTATFKEIRHNYESNGCYYHYYAIYSCTGIILRQPYPYVFAYE